MTAAAYGRSVSNGFVWDDHQQVVMNPALRGDSPIRHLFAGDVRFAEHSQTVRGAVYRPLQLVMYRLVLAVAGMDAGAFHAASLMLSALGVLAAWWVLRRLTGRDGVALAGAALFAAYPVHAEAVDWIASVPDLGCGLGLLVAFGCWLGREKRRWMLPASWAAFGVALLFKETAIVFPAVIAAYLLCTAPAEERSWKSRWRAAVVASAPYWLVLAAYAAVRWFALNGVQAGRRDWLLSPVQYAVNALWLLVEYFGKLLVPFELNAYDTFHPIRSLADWRAVMAIVVIAALVAAAVFAWKRLRNQFGLAAFGLVWMLLTLLPALNLGALGRNAFAERYLYLPSFGFCLFVVVVAAIIFRRLPKWVAPAVVSALVIAFVVVDIDRTADWKDDETLFAATETQSPDAPFVRNMVALNATDPTTAEREYREAIDLAKAEVPEDRLDEVTADRGVASLAADRGDMTTALAMLDASDKIDPGNADAAGERGLILARAGQGAAAEPLLEGALKAEPNNENVLAAMGVIARDEHDLPRAEELFKKALAVHPAADGFAAGQHNNLAGVHADRGDLKSATAELREAIRMQPDDPEFHMNLASMLAAQGLLDDARGEAVTAVRLAPHDRGAQELLQKITEAPR